MATHVSGLFVYPVKSCRGIALEAAELGTRGIRLDREWMVVNERGTFISQRSYVRLALVETALTEARLRLSAPEMGYIEVPLAHEPGPAAEVTVWGDRCAAVDQGEEAARWFGELLKTPCRLVRMAPDWVRPVNPRYAPPGSQVGFADGYPLLVLSEASLADLNTRLAEPLPMDRFRPNLVVTGCEAYAEDTWPAVRVGEVTLRAAKPCVRCKITTIDQQTARPTGEEPLRTLATYRQIDKGQIFGQNMVHASPGRIALGDALEVAALAGPV
ncbi:MOSC domain-containing protein [Gloeobacter violaceus]|uniref:Gll3081 protein n=1 Tax=Gloeobacter violaceus (strain ATCC 29082 / PCC 7421) TaxID=251221 RepID=Q7NC98_GLOVI|nr:MOSC N-terminal beta barrel domain-containing protein [Gloeobacter violaceus]BAC91022.1 gll3081 [Gloeobacter violaceus PCC 7421]